MLNWIKTRQAVPIARLSYYSRPSIGGERILRRPTLHVEWGNNQFGDYSAMSVAFMLPDDLDPRLIKFLEFHEVTSSGASRTWFASANLRFHWDRRDRRRGYPRLGCMCHCTPDRGEIDGVNIRDRSYYPSPELLIL